MMKGAIRKVKVFLFCFLNLETEQSYNKVNILHYLWSSSRLLKCSDAVITDHRNDEETKQALCKIRQ